MTTQQAPPTADQVRTMWDGIADGFDRFVTPQTMSISQQVLDHLALPPGSRLLDVAAGSGALSILAARGGHDVLATDIAPTMVERLTDRCRAEGLTLEARVMDGTALELADGSVDAAVSLNGVSLFPDLARGLAEMARVTRRGGRVVLACFGAPQTVEFIGFVMAAAKASVPGFTPLPTDPPPLPFQVADPAAMTARLREAGLREVEVLPLRADMRIDSGEHLWNVFISSNPLASHLVSGITKEQRGEVVEVLDGMLSARSGDSAGAVLHADITLGVGTV